MKRFHSLFIALLLLIPGLGLAYGCHHDGGGPVVYSPAPRVFVVPHSRLPAGNYLETCSRCRVINGILMCYCRDVNGYFHRTALPIAPSCLFTENIDGHLECTRSMMRGHHHYYHYYEEMPDYQRY